MILQILRTGSLTPEGGEIRPESMSLQLSERESTSTVTESAAEPERSVGAWVRDADGRVWRIRSIETDPISRTRTIQLETILKTLGDRIIPDEKGPADMGGTAEEVSAEKAIRHILSYQSDWKLGSIAYTNKEGYSFNGDTLLTALGTVSDSLEDCVWQIDTTSYPFKLSLVKMTWDATCEMRISRNIQSLRRTVDRSKMYTVFYAVGADDLRIPAQRKNTDLYGIKEHTATDSELDTEAKLKSWSKRMLRRHAMPAVTISISGIDLSKATGEPLDKLKIGTVCRVPLPEYNTTISERITKISYSNLIKEPEKVSITMANELADTKSVRSISQAVSAVSESNAKGKRAAGKKGKKDNAWLDDQADKIGLVAQAVAGPGADKDWSRVSSLYADGEGLHGRVVKTEEGVATAEGWIEANDQKVQLGVRKGDVATQLTLEAGNCHLENGDLVVDGYIKSAALYSEIAGLQEVSMRKASILEAGITTINASNIRFTSNSGGYSSYTSIRDVFIDGARIQPAGSNKYKLQVSKNGSWSDAGTFSRATKLTGAFSGNRVTVEADDSTVPKWSRGFVKGTPSWSGDNYRLPVMYFQTDPTRPDGTACTVDVTSIYDEGIAEAKSNPRNSCVSNVEYFSAEGGTSQKSELFYRRSGTYYSAGSYFWYRRDNYMSPTTYYYIND